METNEDVPVETVEDTDTDTDTDARPAAGFVPVEIRRAPALGSAEAVEAILDAIPVPACLTTDDGILERVNPAFLELCGYPAEELLGHHVTKVISPERRATVAERHDAFIISGIDGPEEWDVLTGDGSRRSARANACRVVGADGRYRKVTFAVDVTGTARLEADLAHAHRRLADLSTQDALTGLANHHRTRELLAQAVEAAERYGRGLSAALVDLDHLRVVNETFGHLVGDDLLIGFAHLARAQLRAVDTVGRIGGGTFLLLLPQTSTEGGRAVLERLRVWCRDQLRTPDDEPLGFSAGLVGFVEHEDQDVFFRRADVALRRAKAAGRGRTELG